MLLNHILSLDKRVKIKNYLKKPRIMKYIKTKKTVSFNLTQDQDRSAFEESEDSLIIENEALIMPEGLAMQEARLRSLKAFDAKTPRSSPDRAVKRQAKGGPSSFAKALIQGLIGGHSHSPLT
jgi:hypothetical protein